MKIALICNDTRGGVQPYAALAQSLKSAGHDVIGVAPGDLCSLFTNAGIEAHPLPHSEIATAMAGGGLAEGGTLAAMRAMAREMPRVRVDWSRAAHQAMQGCDLVAGGVGGFATAAAAAESLHLPFLPLHLQPVLCPTARYPGVLLSGVPAWLGPFGRRISHHLSDLGISMMVRQSRAVVRADLGLAGRPRDPSLGLPRLYGLSRHVVPMPEDAHTQMTGYWTLKDSAPPDPALTAFLDRPGPVISIGFGSLGSADPAAMGNLAITAARAAGVRVVLLAGNNGLQATAAEDIMVTAQVAHSWLFPRMSAVIHHGGAGTTAAAALAGRPQLIVPFAVDQPFWGRRIAALGLGPAPIPRKRLTTANLTDAILRMVTNTTMQTLAAELGARLRAEDGIATATRIISNLRLPVN
jgi:sterol 3beta-glucosyltransferase